MRTGFWAMSILACSLAAFANDKPIDWTHAASWRADFDAKGKKIDLRVTLAPGVHAYAAGEPIGRPVNATLDEKNGWKQTGVRLPTGTKKRLGTGLESVVLEGTFTIEIRTQKGKGPAHGILFLQICSEKSCDRPRQHAWKTKE